MNHLQSFENAFTERRFFVPDYQRGYAWEVEQCKDLIEDIELLPDPNGNRREHYTGTLVLHKHVEMPEVDHLDNAGKRYECYDVVDGQQRVTTIVILLNEVCKALESIPSTEAIRSAIRQHYVSTSSMRGGDLFKLTLGLESQEFFRKRILAVPSIGEVVIHSHIRLLEAKDYFAGYLAKKREEMSAEKFLEYVNTLQQKIRHCLMMTVYEVSDASDVGVIFEVMNNRGRPLTELEKVKNYLLYVASKLSLELTHGMAEAINNEWAATLKSLMHADRHSADEDQLFRAHWLMAYDSNRKNWDGSRSVKKRFDLRKYANRQAELRKEVISYVNGLSTAARAYCDIVNPTRTGSFSEIEPQGGIREEVIRASRRLLRTGALASFLPLLMAIRLRHPEDANAYLRVVSLCEKFSFRVYRLFEKRSHTGQSSLFLLGAKAYQGIDTEDICRQMRYLVSIYSPTAEFERLFDEENGRRDWYHWRGLKYLLYCYEEKLAGRDMVQVPWENVEKQTLEQTIEHVLPQTVDPSTPDGSHWDKLFDLEIRSRWIHDIGNLTLTQHNSTYRNLVFATKKGRAGQEKHCYANSNLFIERSLCRFEEWDLMSLRQRRNEIAAWAKANWMVEEEDLAVLISEIAPENDDDDAPSDDE